MKVFQASTFKRTTKRLHSQQKHELDKAIKLLAKDPAVGSLEKGDLADVRVYKFHMVTQLMLLAYCYQGNKPITLLALGTHKNFYRNLKSKP